MDFIYSVLKIVLCGLLTLKISQMPVDFVICFKYKDTFLLTEIHFLSQGDDAVKLKILIYTMISIISREIIFIIYTEQ